MLYNFVYLLTFFISEYHFFTAFSISSLLYNLLLPALILAFIPSQFPKLILC